jgi:hypothetical protein
MPSEAGLCRNARGRHGGVGQELAAGIASKSPIEHRPPSWFWFTSSQ